MKEKTNVIREIIDILFNMMFILLATRIGMFFDSYFVASSMSFVFFLIFFKD